MQANLRAILFGDGAICAVATWAGHFALAAGHPGATGQDGGTPPWPCGYKFRHDIEVAPCDGRHIGSSHVPLQSQELGRLCGRLHIAWKSFLHLPNLGGAGHPFHGCIWLPARMDLVLPAREEACRRNGGMDRQVLGGKP